MGDIQTDLYGEHLGGTLGWVLVKPPKGWRIYQFRLMDDGDIELSYEKTLKKGG